MPTTRKDIHSSKQISTQKVGNVSLAFHSVEFSSIEETLKTIKELEEAIQTRQSETMRSTYRQKLCSLLSDFLLNQSCSLSLEKEITSIMWRTCFYNRIGEIRERINREQKKQKRLSTATDSTDRYVIDVNSIAASSFATGSKNDKSKLDELHSIFRTFLSEAIMLYDFLVTTFQKNLELGHNSDQFRNASIQTREHTAQVQILHSLLIHRGDLHRYLGDNNKTEASYQAAILLMPGIGTPYNQMAVVCQGKDQSCLALYYYSRSLLATQEPFATSNANLRRLFHSNEEWLKLNAESNHSMELSDTTSKISKQDKKAGAVKLFLAKYVGLHGLFFNFVPKTNISSKMADPFDQDMESKMNNIIESCDSVLKYLTHMLSEQYLGDTLVLKMIVVNIFIVVHLHQSIKSVALAKTDELSSGLSKKDTEYIKCLPAVALNFSYRFGMVLVEQIRSTLQHLLKTTLQGADAASVASGGEQSHDDSTGRHSAGSQNKSIRLLSCIGLFCDWLRLGELESFLTNNSDSFETVSERAAAVAINGHNSFYACVAELWNEILRHKDLVSLIEGPTRNLILNGPPQLQLKEHFQLRGFAPFACFVSQNDQQKWINFPKNLELAVRLHRLELIVQMKCQMRKKMGTLFPETAPELKLNVEVNRTSEIFENKNQGCKSKGDNTSTLLKITNDDGSEDNLFHSKNKPPPGFSSVRTPTKAHPHAPPGFGIAKTANPFVSSQNIPHGMNETGESFESAYSSLNLSTLISEFRQGENIENRNIDKTIIWGDLGNDDSLLMGYNRFGNMGETPLASQFHSAEHSWWFGIEDDSFKIGSQDSSKITGSRIRFSTSGRDRSRLPAANETVSSLSPFLM